MKALLGAFNQEKALVGAFSAIVQLHRLIVYSTKKDKALHQFLLAMTGISLTLSESSHTTEPVLCLLAPQQPMGAGTTGRWTNGGPGRGHVTKRHAQRHALPLYMRQYLPLSLCVVNLIFSWQLSSWVCVVINLLILCCSERLLVQRSLVSLS